MPTATPMITTTDADDSRRGAWSGYWQAGALHSCPGSFGDAYGGAIGEFWRQVVDSMQAGERVLDVGTGNGPLPRLISQRHGQMCPRIDAVDVASLRPDWWSAAACPQVHFHPGISVTDLPFEPGSFDWLISQYGFEYGDRAGSIAECRRVLAPGGRVAMVLHHADSVVCRIGRAEREHYRFLLADDGLLAAAAAVVPHLHEAAVHGPAAVASDPRALAARNAYNAAMTQIAARIDAATAVDALVETRNSAHALVCNAGAQPVDASLASLHELIGQLQAAATRLADMLEHALDEPSVHAIAAALAPADGASQVSWRVLQQQEGILGWALRID